MKTFLLVLGVGLFILGLQDAVRLLADAEAGSIFSFLPGETSLYLGLDVALAAAGAFIATDASKKDKTTK